MNPDNNNIEMVVAHDMNQVIGYESQIPWRGRLPADMKHFKELTTGNTVLMGRLTYDSIGRPLPDRKNIVITRNDELHIEGVEIVHSLDEALAAQVEGEVMFIAGGSEVYELFKPVASRMHITKIQAEFEGDSLFIDVDPATWRLTMSHTNMPDDNNEYIYTFCTYERR